MGDHIPEDSKERLEAAYDRFAAHVVEALQSGRSLGRQGFEAAMEKARAQLAAAGEFSAGQGERFKEFLRRDLGPHLEEQAQAARQFGREAGQHLQPERLRDGLLATLATVLRSGGETLQEWSHKADQAVIYESGEITSAGTLTCLNCGHAIHLDKTAHVAPCPVCLGTRFRKSY